MNNLKARHGIKHCTNYFTAIYDTIKAHEATVATASSAPTQETRAQEAVAAVWVRVAAAIANLSPPKPSRGSCAVTRATRPTMVATNTSMQGMSVHL